MKRARIACALFALLVPGIACAQEPDYASEDGLRLSLGAGVNLVGGPDTEVDGVEIGDPAIDYAPLPTPVGVLRVDVPVHAHWLLGLQAGAFGWETKFEEQLDYGNHLTIDVSALARMRIPLDRARRSELIGSLALGPSFDSVEPSPRSSGEDIDGEVGFHLGGFVSYQLKPRTFPMGLFVDLGFTYHWLAQTSVFASGGSDEVAYYPLSTFLRLGAMFILR